MAAAISSFCFCFLNAAYTRSFSGEMKYWYSQPVICTFSRNSRGLCCPSYPGQPSLLKAADRAEAALQTQPVLKYIWEHFRQQFALAYNEILCCPVPWGTLSSPTALDLLRQVTVNLHVPKTVKPAKTRCRRHPPPHGQNPFPDRLTRGLS